MKIGYIGLGKMGLNMTERLLDKKYEVVVFNRSPESVRKAEQLGAGSAATLPGLVKELASPRLIWIMVPHSAVDDVLSELLPYLTPHDTVIDGGNSPYTASIEHAQSLRKKDINFLDVGVSGGPEGARQGACLMVGGDKRIYEKFEELFKDLSVEGGCSYVGEAGAGHFVKMVHNGIEYGMMQAIAEGFAIMKASDYTLNLKDISEVYNHRSVVESRLIGWLSSAYKEYGEELESISGEVEHTGEGEWTIKEAERLNVPAAVIKQSLKFRVESEGNPSYTGQIVSALRNQFGGHRVIKDKQ